MEDKVKDTAYNSDLSEYAIEVKRNELKFKNLLKQDKLHHAWLIKGSPSFENVYRLVAIILFPDLTIEKGVETLNSGSCTNFMCIRRGTDLDDKNANKQTIGIDQIRIGIKFLTFKGDKHNRRVLLIDSFDELSRVAPHTLLKTTEEPSSGSYLLMICKQPRRILPTLRSRCQVISYPDFCYQTFLSENIKKYDEVTLQLVWWITNKKYQDALAVIKIPQFLVYLDEIMKWFAKPSLIQTSQARKTLQSFEHSCTTYDREHKINNTKGCFMYLATSIYRILLTACIGKYDSDMLLSLPDKTKDWLDNANETLSVIAPEFHMVFIDECWKILKKGDKSKLNLPGVYCLQELIASLNNPNTIIKDTVLSD